MANSRSLEFLNGIATTSNEHLDAKFFIQDNTERDALITGNQIKIGFVMYHVADNKLYWLKTYPTEGSLTGVVWEEVGSQETTVVHIADTNNPHNVTLDQVLTEGNTSLLGMDVGGIIADSLNSSYITDGLVSWNSAQFNRSGGNIEFQWNGGTSNGVRWFGNTAFASSFDGTNGQLNLGGFLNASSGANVTGTLNVTQGITGNRVYSDNQALANNELVRLDQLNSIVGGLDWQESVLDQLDLTVSEPASPTVGDRYISTVTGTSSQTTQSVTIDYIYEWNGTDWTEFIPNEGWTAWVGDVDTNFTYNGSAWVEFGSTVSHNNTTGLQGGALAEYYHLDLSDYTNLTADSANLAYTNINNNFSTNQSITGTLTTTSNINAGNDIDLTSNIYVGGAVTTLSNQDLLLTANGTGEVNIGKNINITGNVNFDTFTRRLAFDSNNYLDYNIWQASASGGMQINNSAGSVLVYAGGNLGYTLNSAGTSLFEGLIAHKSGIRVLNLAENGYIDWAQRNAGGSEVLMDLSSLGNVTMQGALQVGTASNDNQITIDRLNTGDYIVFNRSGANIANISVSSTGLRFDAIDGGNIVFNPNSLDTNFIIYSDTLTAFNVDGATGEVNIGGALGVTGNSTFNGTSNTFNTESIVINGNAPTITTNDSGGGSGLRFNTRGTTAGQPIIRFQHEGNTRYTFNGQGIMEISDGTDTVSYTYFGMESARSSTYVRPDTNGSHTLFIGGNAQDANDWNAVRVFADNGLFYNGELVATQQYVQSQVGANDTLQEITTNGNTTDQGIVITSGGIDTTGDSNIIGTLDVSSSVQASTFLMDSASGWLVKNTSGNHGVHFDGTSVHLQSSGVNTVSANGTTVTLRNTTVSGTLGVTSTSSFDNRATIDNTGFNSHLRLIRTENTFDNTWDITLSGGNTVNRLTFTPETATGYDSTRRLHFSASIPTIEPQTTNLWDIGTDTARFKDLYLSGDVDVTGAITAASVGVTNIVTNRIVKFNGSTLDDSSLLDTGSTVTSTAQIDIERDDNDILHLYRPNSSTAAQVGIDFDLNDDLAVRRRYARIMADIVDNDNGSTDGELRFNITENSSGVDRFIVTTGGIETSGTFLSNGIWTNSSAVTYWGAGSSQTAYGIMTWGSGYSAVYGSTGNELRLGGNGTQNTLVLDSASADLTGTLDVTGVVNLGTTGVNVNIGSTSSSVINMLRTGLNYISATDASGAIRLITGGNSTANYTLELAADRTANFASDLDVDGIVTWNTSRNHGNARNLVIGYSGGNYGGFGYGIAYTATSGLHNYVLNDRVTRVDLDEGIVVYSAPTGTNGNPVTWTETFTAIGRESHATFKGENLATEAYVDAQVGANNDLQEVTDNGATTDNTITSTSGANKNFLNSITTSNAAIADIQWRNQDTATDDRDVIIRGLSADGASTARGGQLTIFTKIPNTTSFASYSLQHDSFTTPGAITAGGNINAATYNLTIKNVDFDGDTNDWEIQSTDGQTYLNFMDTTAGSSIFRLDKTIINTYRSLNVGGELDISGTITVDGELSTFGDGTHDHQRIVITSTNNGVNPAANLDVGSELRLRNSSTTNGNFNAISNYNSNNLVTSRIAMENDDVTNRHGVISFLTHNGSGLAEKFSIDETGVNVTGDFDVTLSTNTATFTGSNDAQLRLVGDDSWSGIGFLGSSGTQGYLYYNSPGEYFQMTQDLYVLGNLLNLGGGSNTGQVRMSLQQDDNASNGWYMGYFSNSGNNLGFYGYENASFQVYTNNTLAFTIDASQHTSLEGNLRLGDSAFLQIGDSSDLQLYHDGTHSYIHDNGTGEIIFRNGVTNTSFFSSNGQYFYDNMSTYWGGGADLQIYHDGTDNRVRALNGDLYIDALASGNDILFRTELTDGTLHSAMGIYGGSQTFVRLFHNNNNRLETTAAGIKVTASTSGNAQVHLAANNEGTSQDNWYIRALHSDKDFVILSDATEVFRLTDSTGNLTALGSGEFGGTVTGTVGFFQEVRTNNGQQLVLNAGESHAQATGQTNEYVYINAESGLEINCSPDNWASLWAGRITHSFGHLSSTIGNNLFVNGNVDIPDSGQLLLGTGDDFKIYHNGTRSYIESDTGILQISQNQDAGQIWIMADNSAGTEQFAITVGEHPSDVDVRLHYANSSKLQTVSTGIQVNGDVTSTSDMAVRTTGDTLTLEAGGTSGTQIEINDSAGEISFNADLVVEAGSSATSDSFVTRGGSSSQFVKGDGTLDSNTYITSVGSSYVQRDQVEQYTRQQYFWTELLGESSSTISWNLDSAQVANITLTGNWTLANPTNMKAGATYMIVIKQDATGSRTLSYGSNYEFGDDGTPTLSTGANKADILTFMSDGTNMFFLGIKKGFDNYDLNCHSC